jgi:hypothetical protein
VKNFAQLAFATAALILYAAIMIILVSHIASHGPRILQIYSDSTVLKKERNSLALEITKIRTKQDVLSKSFVFFYDTSESIITDFEKRKDNRKY